MKCAKCKMPAKAKFKHTGNLCQNHFLELIEKRVRKGLRTQKLIKKNDKILFIDNKSKEYYVSNYLLKSIIKNLPVKIDTKKSKKLTLASAKHNKIIIPWSLDDEAEEFLELIFNKKQPLKFNKKALKLLGNVSEEEIELFAKIKRFKYKKTSKSKIKQMLDKMENKYPGYKFSLLNSIKQIKELK